MKMSLPAKAATILIAAESPADLGPLSDALGSAGINVCLVTRADAAVAALAGGAISLALIDVAMHQRDGFALCALIRTSEGTRDMPVFLLSAQPSAAEARRSQDCGANEYLARPFDVGHAVEKIRVHLSPRQSGIDPRALQVNYHALLTGSPDSVCLLDMDSARLIDVNAKVCALFGLSERDLLSRRLSQLCPTFQRNGAPSQQLLDGFIARVCNGALQVFEADFQHSSGRTIECELRLVIMPAPNQRLMHIRMIDVTRRNRAERLRKGQGRVLEMVARGDDLTATLNELMLLIESQSEGVICWAMTGSACALARLPACRTITWPRLTGFQSVHKWALAAPPCSARKRWSSQTSRTIPCGRRTRRWPNRTACAPAGPRPSTSTTTMYWAASPCTTARCARPTGMTCA